MYNSNVILRNYTTLETPIVETKELSTSNIVGYIDRNWSMSNKSRNKLAHSLNGNTSSLDMLASVSVNPVRHCNYQDYVVAGPSRYTKSHLCSITLRRHETVIKIVKDTKFLILSFSDNHLSTYVTGAPTNHDVLLNTTYLLTDINDVCVFTDTNHALEFSYRDHYFLIRRRIVSDNEYTWDVTSRCRNKTAHIANGNTKRRHFKCTMDLTPYKSKDGNLTQVGYDLLCQSLARFKCDVHTPLNRLFKCIDDEKIKNQVSVAAGSFSDMTIVKHEENIHALWIKNYHYRKSLMSPNDYLSNDDSKNVKSASSSSSSDSDTESIADTVIRPTTIPINKNGDSGPLDYPLSQDLSDDDDDEKIDVVDNDNGLPVPVLSELSDNDDDDVPEVVPPLVGIVPIIPPVNAPGLLPAVVPPIIPGIGLPVAVPPPIVPPVVPALPVAEPVEIANLDIDLIEPSIYSKFKSWLKKQLKAEEPDDINLLTNGNIQPLDKPQPTRLIGQDLQKTHITKFYRTNIVSLHNENLFTILSCKTPDYRTDELGGGMFFYKRKEKIDIPQDYVTHSYTFWTGRDLDETNYRIWVRQTETYLSNTTLEGKLFTNTMAHGPAITMYYDYAKRWQSDKISREQRMRIKHGQMWKRFEWFKKIIYWMVVLFLINYYVIKSVFGAGDIPLANFTTPLLTPSQESAYNIPVTRWFQSTYCEQMFNDYYKSNCFYHPWDCNMKEADYYGDRFVDYLVKACDDYVYNNQFRPMLDHYFSLVYTNFKIITCFDNKLLFFILPYIINNIIPIVVSPIIEEMGRDYKSTIFLIIIERFCYGSFVTMPIHLLLFLLSWCINDSKRMVLHSCYNLLAIYYKSNPASSMLPFGFKILKSVAKANQVGWAQYTKYPLLNYAMNDGFKCKPVKFRPDSKMIVPTNPRYHKLITKYQYIVGPISNSYKPIAFSSNIINEKAAIEARILKETPEPEDKLIDDFQKWVKRNLFQLFPKTKKRRIKSLSFEEYLLNSNASPGVKKTLQQTYDRMVKDGYNCNKKLSKSVINKWCERKSFVKVENLLYKTDKGVKDKPPRLIQGAQPEFIVLVGPWISALQKSIKEDWNCNNFICFTSGVDSRKAAKLATKFDKWLEDDVSHWDASCCEKLLKFEHWLFSKFGIPIAVSQLIQKNINTKGKTTHKIKYKRKGCRKSGDPYTSLGNSILNGLIHLYIYCTLTKKSVARARLCITMLVQGDDNLLNMSSGEAEINWKQEMAKFGFEAVAVYKTERSLVEFCSMRMYSVKEGVVFGPKPGKVMAKFGVFCDANIKTNALETLRGTALGLIPSSYHIPPLKVLIDRVLNLTKHVGACISTVHQDWKLRFKPCTTNEGTWFDLFKVYSWDQWFNNSMEKEYSKATIGSTRLGPVSEYMMDRDTSGPKLLLWNLA